MAMVYLSLHTFMQYWDLYDYVGDFDMVVLNVLETTIMTTTFAALIILQRNKRLESAIIAMRKYIADVSLLEDTQEKRVYHTHNSVAYFFGKYAIIVVCSTASLMYMRPLITMLLGYQGYVNSTMSYQLPYRAHIIFDYTTDARIYSLLYLYQLPVTCVPGCHATVVTFIFNLVLHFCGRLSVLSYRIRNISTESRRSVNDGIKKAVATHLELTESIRSLNDTISVILLLELLGCCSRLGLSMFVVLTKFGTDLAGVITYGLYAIAQAGWLYSFCYIGEQTIFESQKVGEAFYELNWPAVENNDRKSLLICIVNGYKTLHLTAGKIYTFSLFGFTSIMKTAMGCLSMLRANM